MLAAVYAFGIFTYLNRYSIRSFLQRQLKHHATKIQRTAC